MDERIRTAVGDGPAWVVGGALRDELLGREIVDVDVACADPELAARLYSRLSRRCCLPALGAPRRLARRLPGGQTVDFTPLHGDDDRGGPGHARLHGQRARAVTRGRCARSTRTAGEADLAEKRASRGRLGASSRTTRCAFCARSGSRTSSGSGSTTRPRSSSGLRQAASASRPASASSPSSSGSRPDGFRRADELGLLEPLGGSLSGLDRVDPADTPGFLLVVVFGEGLKAFPVSNDLSRLARTLLAAERPADDSPRAIHRFRRRTEPWAVSALAFLGATDLYDAVRAARAADHAEPLLRGEDVLELGVEAGPEVGRLLELVAEERAVGTISTRDDALELVRAELGA